MRRIPALIGAAALVAVALTGCTGSVLGGCDPILSSGDASSTVDVTGAQGSAPTADFPTPLLSKKPQATTLITGDGEQLKRSGGQADFSVTYYDAATGEKQAAVGYGTPTSDDPPSRAAVGLDGYAIGEALSCAHVGDRIVLTASAAAAFGPDQGDDSTYYVFVIDVLADYLGKADGFNQLPQDGLPVVVTEVDGTPAIALTNLTAPTTTRTETVKGGGGKVIRKDDRVVVHLRAWTWPTDATGDPAEFASTWGGSQQAYTMTMDGASDNPVPLGVQKAVTGAKVGSQLLIVIPPGADGYATPPQGLTADSIMIWVVDVLGVQKSE